MTLTAANRFAARLYREGRAPRMYRVASTTRCATWIYRVEYD